MSKLLRKLILIMRCLLAEHYLQIWLPAEYATILMVIYLDHLVIIMAALRVTELVNTAIKTHVLEQAENVYC
nr:MAG TPA: hypothetical protein [Caudoviricetes sp.]